jgi:hypothetical protein
MSIIVGVSILLAGMGFTVLLLKLSAQRDRAELEALEARLRGIDMVKHAMAYLAPHGIGEHLGDARARIILEYALQSLLYNHD